jgi:HEPN domain-containing protein
MNIVQIENWQEYRRDGEQFLHTALMARKKNKKHFTPEILYNLTGMAIEKLIMAYLMKNGDLADNHTMGDLLTALERHAGSQPELAEKLHYLDSFQEICDLEAYSVKIPTQEDTEVILAIGQKISDFLAPHLTN